MIRDPHDPEWDDVPCPPCQGDGARTLYHYENDDPIARRIIKTRVDCELCEGSGVVPPSVFDDYRRDPLGALARRAAR